ncbi:AI-2E family transporter [Sphingomonas sabuli]|uniref:AI-2E family transporter n=1 Tax=Sphingomonas sabuli TaxID=2764186 RepID=A0A7G9L4F4_9SPHN|nr:AI-2E family transporter [Sphingomonas sabuli]QNM83503.1 AI-2E family transporter [Sphingomonas sabuli]
MAKRSGDVAMVVTGTAAGIALLYFLRPILIPLILALVLAVLVSAVERFIRNRSDNAPRWAPPLVAGLLVLFGAVVASMVIAQGTAQIVTQAPALIGRIDTIVHDLSRGAGIEREISIATLVGSINIPQLAGQLAGSVSNLVSSLLLMLTYFLFIIAGRAKTRKKFAHLSELPSSSGRIEAAAGRVADDIETYIWVQTVTGLMICVPAAIAMFAIGLDNTLFWTVILFLLSFIPILGVTVGSVVPALFALLQYTTWWQAAFVFGAIQVAAFVVGNLIYPRMQAKTQNIDPIATLLSLAFWGWLWGLAGAFLAVPMTLIVMFACAHFPNARWVAVLLSNDGRVAVPGEKPEAIAEKGER